MPTTGYPVHRTPEQGHTAPCLAKAMIAAVENVRDAAMDDARRLGQPELGDTDFRIQAQDNHFLALAYQYLEEGLTECLCPCLHANKRRSNGWDHGFRQWLCLDCDAVIDAPGYHRP